MNKKECINLINELFEKLDDAKRQIFELETELAKKEEVSPEQERVELTEETPEQPEETAYDTVQEPEPETEQPEIREQPKVQEPKPEKDEVIELPTLKASPAFSEIGEDVFYASEILSRIVVAAARYSTEITGEFSDDKANGLNGLILSKTSDAKQEILKCVMSDSDLDEKKIDIYNVYNSALDYFESVIAE